MKIEEKFLEKIISILLEEEGKDILSKDEVEFFDSFYENLWSVYYGDIRHEDISLFQKDYTDRINSTGVLHIAINDTEYICVVRDGNFDGSHVEQFDENAEYEPPAQYKHTFELDVDSRWFKSLDENKQRIARKIFRARYAEYQEMCGKYMYDRYFSPTDKIKNHYREYMRKNHLIFLKECVYSKANSRSM